MPYTTPSNEEQPSDRQTVVLQSHRQPLPHPWLDRAMTTVRQWAAAHGYEYVQTDDALFAELTAKELRQCGDQRVVASDLARLRLCQRYLREGADRVVWCDADTLIIDGHAPILPRHPGSRTCGFGREIWLQKTARNGKSQSNSPGKLKVYRKIHNAFMHFDQGDPVLDFYAYSAARLIDRHSETSQRPMVAQLAGPKFLTHLHNVLQFDVLETAQVLSPVLCHALLNESPDVLALYASSWAKPPAALNLCASEVLRGSLSEDDMAQIIELLLRSGPGVFDSLREGV